MSLIDAFLVSKRGITLTMFPALPSSFRVAVECTSSAHPTAEYSSSKLDFVCRLSFIFQLLGRIETVVLRALGAYQKRG